MPATPSYHERSRSNPREANVKAYGGLYFAGSGRGVRIVWPRREGQPGVRRSAKRTRDGRVVEWSSGRVVECDADGVQAPKPPNALRLPGL
jgi:hypothetical protein